MVRFRTVVCIILASQIHLKIKIFLAVELSTVSVFVFMVK
jgi:hypothetical protein